MKKLCLTVAMVIVLSSPGLASPLTDFSEGKGAIDLTWRNTEMIGTADVTGRSVAFNKDYSLDGSLTVGLGNNFAVQYGALAPKSKTTFNSPDYESLKLTLSEANVLYKIDGNIAAFAGYVSSKAQQTSTNAASNFTTRTKNLWQVGVVGSAAIADKTSLWASLAGGSNITNWSAGVSYEVAPSVEVSLNYRETKVKNMGATAGGTDFNLDGEAKGLGVGITYKF